MINLRDKRIAVTGGNGFLGQHLVRRLRDNRGCEKVFVADLPDYDLRDLGQIRRMYDDLKPEIVIHLAAVVGGIGANRDNPGRFFYDNAIMGIQLIHEGHLRGIEKMVILGTVCCYPKYAPVPFNEDDLWNGYPEETNAPYGLAKKMLLVQSQAYRQQYGLNSIFLLPVNLYGPGDNFDPQELACHSRTDQEVPGRESERGALDLCLGERKSDEGIPVCEGRGRRDHPGRREI